MATTQQFVQPLAQANSPFLANNGNPNTVYNTSATPFNNLPVGVSSWTPSGPFLAPATGAGRTVPASAYSAPESQFWRNLSTFSPVGFNLGDSGAINPDPGWTPLPPAQPPGTLPPVTTDTPPPTTPPGGGGNTGPGFGSNTGGLGYTGQLGGTFWDRGLFGRPSGGGSIPSTGGGSTTSNWFSNLVGTFGDRLSNMTVWDAIDAILPGDIFNSNGGVNVDQALISGLNQIVPGLGNIADAFATNGWLGDAAADALTNYRLRDLPQVNSAISEQLGNWSDSAITDIFNNATGNWGTIDPIIRNIPMADWGFGFTSMPEVSTDPVGLGGPSVFDSAWLEQDWLNQSGGAGRRRDSRSGRAAGSNILAEGEAAQDMVRDMQIDQWLRGSAAQARTAFERMFGGHNR